MPTFNLDSPTAIASHFDPHNCDAWLSNEINAIENPAIRSVVETVCENMGHFVEFPSRAILLWEGCDRVAAEGKRQKYHRYPDDIRTIAKKNGLTLDSRPNGPAIASFLIAGGNRPTRSGSSNAWSIHHLYSGKYPYFGRPSTTHAAKDGWHFTQSAGLVAVQPIADAICDEFPFFAWLLRAQAFRRFGYDPDRVFAESHDQHGFVTGCVCEVSSQRMQQS